MPEVLTSRKPLFQIQARTLVIVRLLWFSSIPLHKSRDNLKLDHGRFLLRSSKCAIHYINNTYDILVKASSLNNPLIDIYFWLRVIKIKRNTPLMVVTTPNVYYNFEIQHKF